MPSPPLVLACPPACLTLSPPLPSSPSSPSSPSHRLHPTWRSFGAGLCTRLKGAGAASFEEMTGGGDVALASVERLAWKVRGEQQPGSPPPPPPVPLPGRSMVVTVAPADTRTFKLSL